MSGFTEEQFLTALLANAGRNDSKRISGGICVCRWAEAQGLQELHGEAFFCIGFNAWLSQQVTEDEDSIDT